jgi:hypothetical protein
MERCKLSRCWQLTYVIVFLMLGVSFLYSCATLNINNDYWLSEQNGEGLVVVSLSYEGLAREDSPSWSYHCLGSDENLRIYARAARVPLDWESPPGRLAVFALPAGSYEFYRCEFAGLSSRTNRLVWRTGKSGAVTPNNPDYAGFDTPSYTAIKAEPFIVRFEVSAGKAVYLGNLHLLWNEDERKGRVTVRDTSERDLSLLQQKFPQIERRQIDVAALPASSRKAR